MSFSSEFELCHPHSKPNFTDEEPVVSTARPALGYALQDHIRVKSHPMAKSAFERISADIRYQYEQGKQKKHRIKNVDAKFEQSLAECCDALKAPPARGGEGGIVSRRRAALEAAIERVSAAAASAAALHAALRDTQADEMSRVRNVNKSHASKSGTILFSASASMRRHDLRYTEERFARARRYACTNKCRRIETLTLNSV
eukprot:515147-Pleurochrysis_carterae.AAC.1